MSVLIRTGEQNLLKKLRKLMYEQTYQRGADLPAATHGDEQRKHRASISKPGVSSEGVQEADKGMDHNGEEKKEAEAEAGGNGSNGNEELQRERTERLTRERFTMHVATKVSSRCLTGPGPGPRAPASHPVTCNL